MLVVFLIQWNPRSRLSGGKKKNGRARGGWCWNRFPGAENSIEHRHSHAHTDTYRWTHAHTHRRFRSRSLDFFFTRVLGTVYQIDGDHFILSFRIWLAADVIETAVPDDGRIQLDWWNQPCTVGWICVCVCVGSTHSLTTLTGLSHNPRDYATEKPRRRSYSNSERRMILLGSTDRQISSEPSFRTRRDGACRAAERHQSGESCMVVVGHTLMVCTSGKCTMCECVRVHVFADSCVPKYNRSF